MVFRLTLIAHAATEATHAARFAAPADELSRAGVGAASRLAKSAALDPSPELVVLAPELRCERTAERLGLPAARVDDAFADLDLGEWTSKDLAALPGEEIAAWTTDPDFAGHGGESIASACARIGLGLDALTGDGASSAVVVAHPSTLRAAVIHCLSAPAGAFFRIDAGPGHTLCLHGRGGRWALRF